MVSCNNVLFIQSFVHGFLPGVFIHLLMVSYNKVLYLFNHLLMVSYQVLHRDLKPENLLMIENRPGQPSDQLRIADFGKPLGIFTFLAFSERATTLCRTCAKY